MLGDLIAKNGIYKSRKEFQIAGLLDRYGLPFIYEKPTAVMDQEKLKIWHPDFTLKGGPIIEYFGVQGNQDYGRRTQHKLQTYHENQYTVIPLFPQDMKRGWEKRVLNRIDGALEKPWRTYRRSVASAGYRSGPRAGYRRF
jgi:hypothetical protein